MRLFSFLRGHKPRVPALSPPPPLLVPPPPRPRRAEGELHFTLVDLPWLTLRLTGPAWRRSGNQQAFLYYGPLGKPNGHAKLVVYTPGHRDHPVKMLPRAPGLKSCW